MEGVPDRRRSLLAFGDVYFIWGSTFLAVRFGLESFPPFFLSGLRFLLAGLAMYLVLWTFGTPVPSRRQWWNLARVSVLMMLGGAGLVTAAQDVGVGSGLAATAVAMIPLWAALVSGLLGAWPRRAEWVGLVVGLLGVAVLLHEGDFRSTGLGWSW